MKNLVFICNQAIRAYWLVRGSVKDKEADRDLCKMYKLAKRMRKDCKKHAVDDVTAEAFVWNLNRLCSEPATDLCCRTNGNKRAKAGFDLLCEIQEWCHHVKEHFRLKEKWRRDKCDKHPERIDDDSDKEYPDSDYDSDYCGV